MIYPHELIVDLFAGGGGASTGIEAALGRPVDRAVNHDPVAIAVHLANHPGTIHYVKDVFEAKPSDVTGGQPVGLLWASPDCTHFSVAKGDVPRSKGIRSLAWVVVDWAREVAPRVICLENVREFQGWGPLSPDGRPDKTRQGETFREWVQALEALGYAVGWKVLDSADFGAPTRRKRLFLVARRDGALIEWPEPTHGSALLGLQPFRTAAECIDFTLPCPSIFTRKKPLAEKTLWRIAQGIRRFVLENPQPFIIGCGGRAGQTAPTGANSPLGTITAKNDRSMVTAFLAKHFGGVVGQIVEKPIGTITAKDHHSLAAVCLAKFRGTDPKQPASLPVTEPIPTISAGGVHVAEVRAFLVAYYGSGSIGQDLNRPLRTVTAKHRLGLVTVQGIDYQIVDIGMRMLEPEELLRAQFGEFAAGYDLEQARTKAGKVRLIGNSVCPEVARALVAAQFNSEPAKMAA